MGNKLFILGLTIGIILICLPAKVSAADMTVTCNSNQCVTDGRGLFNQANMAPGFEVTKSILVDNSNNTDSCNLYLRATREGVVQDSDLAGKLVIAIKSNGTTYFGDENGITPKSFADLFGQNLFLGNINNHSQREYYWKVDFASENGNEYQEKAISFSFNLNFICGTKPIETVSPTIIITPLVTTTHTPILSTILGIATDNNSEMIVLTGISPTPSLVPGNINSGSILELTCENPGYNWWWVLLVQIILTVIILALKYLIPDGKYFWLVPVLLAVVSQLVHNYYGCNCSTGLWCANYWILNLGVVLLSSIGYYVLIRLKTRTS